MADTHLWVRQSRLVIFIWITLSTVVGAYGHDLISIVAKDLVLNMKQAAHEVPALSDATNAIFGQAIDSQTILDALAVK